MLEYYLFENARGMGLDPGKLGFGLCVHSYGMSSAQFGR